MAGMERFTQRARRVLSLAHQEAEQSRNNNIGTEHLLLGLMDEEGGVAGRVLRELGMTSDRVREVIRRVTTSSSSFDPNRVELAAETQQVLEHAVEEARRLGHHYIGTEHILLGLVRVDSTAMEVLRRLGVTAEQIRRQTRRVLNEFRLIPNARRGKLLAWFYRLWREDPAGGPACHRLNDQSRREKARSRDRASNGNRACDPDPGTPHEEQPRADRRTRRW